MSPLMRERIGKEILLQGYGYSVVVAGLLMWHKTKKKQ